jgi:hypothetical protein
MRPSVWILWTAAILRAQSTGAPDPAAVLGKFREGMLQNLVNQPDYTCLETVERTRQSPGGAMQMQDTLRLEVALVGGREMFSWPGAKQFEDRDLRELIPTGMFGNGNYGLYARILFGGGGPPFLYRESVMLEGRPAFRYDYRVSRNISGFTLRNSDDSAIVGFHGSIFLDPATADIQRLEVIAEDIPPELGLKAAEDSIDYFRAKIGDDEFLLPKESSLLMASTDNTSRNRTRFSGCRKFTGESSIIFEDEEVAEAAKAQAIEVTLPAGATVALELRDLSLSKAAGGDEITAVLKSAIKRDKQTLVPKGAIAKGRLVNIAKLQNSVLLGIRFTELEWTGGHAILKLQFDGFDSIALRRVAASPQGDIQFPAPGPSNLKGEILRFHTLP